MSDNPWDSLARFYDWEHAGFDADLRMYLALARRSGDPILEAACGSGRLVIALAEAGFRVTGFDSSAAMLALAGEKLARAPGLAERVRLVQADMRSAEVDGRFALAILALDGLGLLAEQADQVAALRALRQRLRRGGLLVLDVASGAARAGEPRDELRLHFTRPHPLHGRPLTKWVARATDPARELDRLTYLYDELDPDGAVRRTVAQHALRYFHYPELLLLLERAGLRPEDTYGDYAFGPYSAESERLIVVARRPDDES